MPQTIAHGVQTRGATCRDHNDAWSVREVVYRAVVMRVLVVLLAVGSQQLVGNFDTSGSGMHTCLSDGTTLGDDARRNGLLPREECTLWDRRIQQTLEPLIHWDGVYFLHIARHAYSFEQVPKGSSKALFAVAKLGGLDSLTVCLVA